MLAAVLTGVAYTAQAVEWLLGAARRDVEGEINALERELEGVHRADQSQRRTLVDAYVVRLRALAKSEGERVTDVAAELSAAHAAASHSAAERFGPQASAAFSRSLLRLESDLGRAQAECAYLARWMAAADMLLEHLATRRIEVLPSARSLQLPDDFPRAGHVLSAEQIRRNAHHYRWELVDAPGAGSDGPALVVAVNHLACTAVVSHAAAGAFGYFLSGGSEPLRARVHTNSKQTIGLSYEGLSLALMQRPAESAPIRVGQELAVHPFGWTLASIANAATTPLPVRQHRTIDLAAMVWSPIRLIVEAGDFPCLIEAGERIEKEGISTKPCRVSLDGTGEVRFTLGSVTFCTRPDREQAGFRLLAVSYGQLPARISLRTRVELTALVTGTSDEKDVPRDKFEEFLATLHAELEHEAERYAHHDAAVWLRKLSIIYQDQQRHRIERSTAGFVAGIVDERIAALEGVVLASHGAAWLDALSGQPSPRLVATGPSGEWRVMKFTWVNSDLRVCRLELAAPGSKARLDLQSIDRLQLVGEGRSEEAMSAALERAITGRFVSEAVHQRMMSIAAAKVPNTAKGEGAVEALLARDTPVAAVWGPPGTGKTTTLVRWLASNLPLDSRETWPRVLITGPTHVAVDNLLERLLKDAPWLEDEVVRYAAAGRLEESALAGYWHQRLIRGDDAGVEDDPALAALRAQWNAQVGTRNGALSAANWILGTRRIHAVTCAGLSRADFGLMRQQFDLVIIDEAGKAFGAELMLPASLGHRVVLVGDHNQLPPTVTSDELEDDVGYRFSLDEVEHLLRKNAFHQLFDALPADCKGMLTIQHRMHEDVGNTVSKLFYEGELQSRRQGGQWTATRKRITFVDFAYDERYRHERAERSTSIRNRAEAELLSLLLEALHQAGELIGKTTLVVCPYEGQRSLVARTVGQRWPDLGVEVTTVDAVQGGEADLVLLLFTRSAGRTEFLLDRRRLNVALSRAREAVIILGSTRCLARGADGPVQELLDVGAQLQNTDAIDVDTRSDYARVAKWLVASGQRRTVSHAPTASGRGAKNRRRPLAS